MTILWAVLGVLLAAFMVAYNLFLCVFGVICLFRPRVLQAYGLRQIERYKDHWSARLDPFRHTREAYMQTQGYLWSVRFCGVISLIMGAGGFLILLSPFFSK
jgi:hypothetical protein